MNLSPRKNVSPFRKPQVSFVYQNSPIKSKVSGKENVNLSAFVRPPPSPRVVKKNITVQA